MTKFYKFMEEKTINFDAVYGFNTSVPFGFYNTDIFRPPSKGEWYLSASTYSFAEKATDDFPHDRPRLILHKKQQTLSDLEPGLYKGTLDLYKFDGEGFFCVFIEADEKKLLRLDTNHRIKVHSLSTGYSHDMWSQNPVVDFTPVTVSEIFGEK